MCVSVCGMEQRQTDSQEEGAFRDLPNRAKKKEEEMKRTIRGS